jgi:hypothetical protein
LAALVAVVARGLRLTKVVDCSVEDPHLRLPNYSNGKRRQ